jgi:glutamate carboxypeptidase
MSGSPGTLSDQATRLLAHLRERRAEMTELLVRLAEAESPSSVPESQRQVQGILADELAACGHAVRHLNGRDSGGMLLSAPEDRARGRPLQLLLGHCDTVWPLDTLRTMPVHESEGRLHGPGVFDMKGGLAQMIFALRALRELGLEPEVVPVVFVNSDEEIGSADSVHNIQRLARVADRVFVVERALGHEGSLKTARKGIGRFTVTVKGRAAHAGLDPERGVSAILELSHVVQELFRLNDPERGITVNVGTIDGGIRPNVIAPESRAVVDVRVLHHEDAERVEQAILALAPTTPGTELAAEGKINRPPMERTPANRQIWRRAVAAAGELGLPLEQATAGGGSDGNYTSIFAATPDGVGAVGDGAHAHEEFVFVERMPERSALLARLLLDPPLCRDEGWSD